MFVLIIGTVTWELGPSPTFFFHLIQKNEESPTKIYPINSIFVVDLRILLKVIFKYLCKHPLNFETCSNPCESQESNSSNFLGIKKNEESEHVQKNKTKNDSTGGLSRWAVVFTVVSINFCINSFFLSKIRYLLRVCF